MISIVTFCEVFLTDEFKVESFIVDNNNILVTYEMDFVLSAWSEKTQILRIIGNVLGVCSIPDMEHYDWSSKNFGEMIRNEIVESESIVTIVEL